MRQTCTMSPAILSYKVLRRFSKVCMYNVNTTFLSVLKQTHQIQEIKPRLHQCLNMLWIMVSVQSGIIMLENHVTFLQVQPSSPPLYGSFRCWRYNRDLGAVHNNLRFTRIRTVLVLKPPSPNWKYLVDCKRIRINIFGIF